MKAKLLGGVFLASFAWGCSSSGEVSASDAAKNKAAFSQDAYDEAMKKAGKGDELEAEKARAAARSGGGDAQETGQR